MIVADCMEQKNGNTIYFHSVLGHIRYKTCSKCGKRYPRWKMKLFDRDLGNFKVSSPRFKRGYCMECFMEEWKNAGATQ